MVFLTRAQGLKLQGYFRSSSTETITIEQSPMNPGSIRVTVWNATNGSDSFEITQEGRKIECPTSLF